MIEGRLKTLDKWILSAKFQALIFFFFVTVSWLALFTFKIRSLNLSYPLSVFLAFVFYLVAIGIAALFLIKIYKSFTKKYPLPLWKSLTKEIFSVLFSLAFAIGSILIITNPIGIITQIESAPMGERIYDEKKIATLRDVEYSSSNEFGLVDFDIPYEGDAIVFKDDKMLFSYYESNGCGSGTPTLNVDGNIVSITFKKWSYPNKACSLAVEGPFAYIVDLPKGFSEKEDIKVITYTDVGSGRFELPVKKKTDTEIPRIQE